MGYGNTRLKFSPYLERKQGHPLSAAVQQHYVLTWGSSKRVTFTVVGAWVSQYHIDSEAISEYCDISLLMYVKQSICLIAYHHFNAYTIDACETVYIIMKSVHLSYVYFIWNFHYKPFTYCRGRFSLYVITCMLIITWIHTFLNAGNNLCHYQRIHLLYRWT